MADISDVEQAIVDLIAAAIYPNGTSQSSAVVVAGSHIGGAVYRGWPEPASLDADLAAGLFNVSVFSRGSVERNTTRVGVDYKETSRQVATITAVVVDNTISIAGAPDAGVSQFVSILVGRRVSASYAVLIGDTANSIALALVALLAPQGVSASVAGGIITVESSVNLLATVGVVGSQMAEVRSQQTQVMITLWCPNPAVRDSAAKIIDPVLAQRTFLLLSDTSKARFRYHGTTVSDTGQKASEYRRDLIYDVEYATTITDTATEIADISTNARSGVVAIGVAPGNQLTTSNAPITR